MVKKRVIAVLPLLNGMVVQSFGFKRFLPVGTPPIIVRFLDSWGIDEVVLADIRATRDGTGPDLNTIRSAAKVCRVPLMYAGGIVSVETMRSVIHAGADKVGVSTKLCSRIDLISEGAEVFGDQAMVACIDAVKSSDGEYFACSNGGTERCSITPHALAALAARAGAGEILLTSIDRDGAQQGYDRVLIEKVAAAVNIPLIVCGGAGHPEHLREVLSIDGVSGAAAGNFFHFSEHSVITVKSYLHQQGIRVRLDTHATYQGRTSLTDGRLARRTSEELEKLRFVRVPEEVI